MKTVIIFIIFLFSLIPHFSFALSATAKQKYGYLLLTNDYGILNENDLAALTWGLELEPSPFTGDERSHSSNYWQCFPRVNISMKLKDSGESGIELGWKENWGTVEMNVHSPSKVSHVYLIARSYPFSGMLAVFKEWQKVMQGEKYVCLLGRFAGHNEEKNNAGEVLHTYSWFIDQVKTKKGCEAWFTDCHPTYQKYLKEEAAINKRLNHDG